MGGLVCSGLTPQVVQRSYISNPPISQILGHEPRYYVELDSFYRNYWKGIGFKANDKGAFGVETGTHFYKEKAKNIVN